MMSKFDQLKAKLSKKPGVRNPGGLAAAIGKKKYGASVMAKASAAGKPAASMMKDSDSDGM